MEVFNVNSKPYDRQLDLQYRDQTLKLTSEIMEMCYGYKFAGVNDENRCKYYYDYKYIKGEKEIRIESEITKYYWKYQTTGKLERIDFAARKQKNIAEVFFIIDYWERWAFGIKKVKLLEEMTIIEKNTRYKKNETFMRVNCEHGKFFEKVNGKWQKLL